MKIKDISKAYFIGIKGAGMTAVAQVLHGRKIKISGSDTSEVFYTDSILKKNKIHFHEGFSEAHVPDDADVVVYSTAYTMENNVEMAEAKRKKATMISYPEMLGILFREKLGIAVCGTHGKTTTSAMLAETLRFAGLDPGAIIGSQVISWKGSALSGDGEYFVAEADEYQNKLKYYKPWSAILTSVDWDHPDFFPSFEEYKEVFAEFVAKIPKNGFLIAWGDSIDTLAVAEKAGCKVITYGFGEECDYRAIENETLSLEGKVLHKFEIFHKEKSLGIFETSLIGKHNILNSAAVVAMCHTLKIDLEKIREAIKKFEGTSRRFEKVGTFGGAVVIDDYAHHPDEIKTTLQGARRLFGDKRIWTVFHPHTFTRTKALFQEFSQSFDDTDKVIILDIYGSAREQQGGVSSKDLIELINTYLPGRADYVPTINEAVQFLKENSGQYDVLITMGAGDVWKIGKKLTE